MASSQVPETAPGRGAARTHIRLTAFRQERRYLAAMLTAPGDRVVLPAHTFCGVCLDCARRQCRVPAGPSRAVRTRCRGRVLFPAY